MEELREKIINIIRDYIIKDGRVRVTSRPLSSQEAIGNPEHSDYPIQKGRERLMRADFNGAHGVAFTDMFGDYEGFLYEMVNMKLDNNFRRAIFISTINAMLKSLGLIEKTSHCKDKGLVDCQKSAVNFFKKRFGNVKIFQVGFQPRFVEVLSKEFEFRVTDMDEENIGKRINGVMVERPEEIEKNVQWCDVIFATGSSFVNDTYKQFIVKGKQTVFYGVSCAGPVYLLDLERYCPEGL